MLPDEEAPVLIYRGVEDGGKVAVFELTGVVDAQGDGKCEPTPEDCQYLKLRAGETEFITVTETGTETDAQYQLDLVKIYKKDTKVAKSDLEDEARGAGQGRLGAAWARSVTATSSTRRPARSAREVKPQTRGGKPMIARGGPCARRRSFKAS